MSFTPLHKQRFLIATAVGLISAGAAQATDLYDSLQIWKKQSDEAQKIREQRLGSQPSAAPEHPSLTNPSGPMGPIRSDRIDEQPATEQPVPPSEEMSREPIHNNPEIKSP